MCRVREVDNYVQVVETERMKLSTEGRGRCSDTDPLTFVDTGHMSIRHLATNTNHE